MHLVESLCLFHNSFHWLKIILLALSHFTLVRVILFPQNYSGYGMISLTQIHVALLRIILQNHNHFGWNQFADSNIIITLIPIHFAYSELLCKLIIISVGINSLTQIYAYSDSFRLLKNYTADFQFLFIYGLFGHWRLAWGYRDPYWPMLTFTSGSTWSGTISQEIHSRFSISFQLYTLWGLKISLRLPWPHVLDQYSHCIAHYNCARSSMVQGFLVYALESKYRAKACYSALYHLVSNVQILYQTAESLWF